MPAVTDLSISIKKGIVTGFVGPNGAGKTTSIKMIMGLVAPTRGTVFICGTDARKPASRKGIAYLSEQPYFYAHLTVGESLQFAANLIGIASKQIPAEISRVLSIVELSSQIKVKELSKGMQQRLSMAQALLGDPQVLILDEPMSGMDPPGRRLFRKLFRELVQTGKTIFFSTHVLDDIEMTCDEVIVLSKGKLAFAGEVKALLDEGFLGTEMTVSGIEQSDMEILENLGCRLHCSEKQHGLLFLPQECDLRKVQDYLFEKKKTIHTIARRSKPLDELLYQNS